MLLKKFQSLRWLRHLSADLSSSVSSVFVKHIRGPYCTNIVRPRFYTNALFCRYEEISDGDRATHQSLYRTRIQFGVSQRLQAAGQSLSVDFDFITSLSQV